MAFDAIRRMGEHQDSEGAPASIEATPYECKDPAEIPRRQWLYGRHLIRGFLSATVAPGGVGKSSLGIVEALAMASGRPLLGQLMHPAPLRVWLWNLEDPIDELDRRIAAARLHHGITADDLGDRLFVDSGRNQPLCLARVQRDSGATIVRPVADALVAEMLGREIDVLKVDPFVSSHQVPENDNDAIDLVAKEWGRIAGETNAAIELVHHTRKQQVGAEVTADSARGAKALVDASRSARVMQRMTADEAQKAEVENRRLYVRIFADKVNLAPPVEKSDWIKLHGVTLPNGDDVGVAERWEWPDLDPFAGITTQDLLTAQQTIAGKGYRFDPQATEWAGHAIGEALGIDTRDKPGRRRVSAMLKQWISTGAMKKVGDKKPTLEVGEFATP